MTCSHTQPIAPGPAVEKVGLRCIKVVDRRLRATAVVRDVFAANKLLCGWASRVDEVLECQFEIVYDDGLVVHGDYRFTRKGCKRPRLMAHVRAGGADSTASAEQRTAFLDRYETGDGGDAA